MNSSEAELFFSFGEKWTKSRESWPNSGEIIDFTPQFRSGWIPPPIQPPPNEHPTIFDSGLTDLDPGFAKAKVLRDFVARNEMELSVITGEEIDILDDSRNWWHCRNEYGQRGYVPSNILSKTTPSNRQSRFVKILLFASQVLWWSCQSFFTSITTISILNLISKYVYDI